jgi:hypothetical protein
MRSGQQQRGLALLRLEAIGGALRCGEAELIPDVPSWMRLSQAAPAARPG